MAGVNFDKPSSRVEQVSSVADSVIVNVGGLVLLPNQTRYIVFDNLTEDVFKFFQIPSISSLPSTTVTGISAISTTLLFNTEVTLLDTSPVVNIHSNSNKGNFSDVKGILLDGRETTTPISVPNQLPMGLHTVLNRVDSTYQPYQSQSTYLKPFYIASNSQVVLQVTNTPLDTTGVPVTFNLALMGQFQVYFSGISTNPLLTDNIDFTVDSDVLLTNQVDIT